MSLQLFTAAKRSRGGRSFAVLFILLLAGFLVGGITHVLFQPGTTRPAGETGSSVGQHSAAHESGNQLPGEVARLPDNSGAITFSRQQWSQIVRSPRFQNISLPDCFPGAVPVFNDIPLVGGLFQDDARGPELLHQGWFFGWDEPRMKKLREVLFQYGKEVQGTRRDTPPRVEIPGNGTVLLDYSAASELSVAAHAALMKSIGEIVGPQDARRFALLASLDTPPDRTMTLTVTPALENGWVEVSGFPGGGRATLERYEGGADLIGILKRANSDASFVNWGQLVEEAGMENFGE